MNGADLFVRWGGGEEARFAARLLGLELATDRAFTELAAGPLQALPLCFPASSPWLPRAGQRIFDNEVFVAGGRARMAISWHGERAWLEVDDASIGIDLEARLIEVTSPPVAGAELWLEHVLLGPPLLLGLAHLGVFALHASAARVDGRLVAFLGASGAGKSTLAAGFDGRWQAWADDLVPVRLGAVGGARCQARALGGFPQPKLPAPRRRPGEGEEPVLHAVVLLAGEAPELEAQLLPPTEAAATWVGHTMIARLFPPRLLGDHLAWAAAGGRTVPTWAVRFPRDLTRLDEVREGLADVVG